MRYDDMLPTLLRQPLDTPAARAIAWHQAVDLLVQGRSERAEDEALALLRQLRTALPASVRAGSAALLSERPVAPALLRLFAEEPPAIAAAALGQAIMTPEDWIALLPSLGPTARGFVRNRRDLPAAVVQALASFGASDLVLAGPVTVAAEPATAPPAPLGPTSISDVMARIATYRSRRPSPPPLSSEAAAPVDRFRFETDAEGVIEWTDATPRGAVLGDTIARAGDESGHGVDGHALGAFRSRAPFRDARLMLPDDGALGGAWRMSAVPVFDDASGVFTGYRGVARRPRPDESAGSGKGDLLGTAVQPDALRQLVHELRTPINAIVGFAEMIERQMLGPAGADYRLRATGIASEGRRLLEAVDDLDSAARIGGRRWTIDRGAVDGAGLLARLLSDIEPLARARGLTLAIRTAALPPIDADALAVERMMMRLIQATLGLAAAGETITVTLDGGSGRAELRVGRPAALAGREERVLLDPSYAPDGEWPDAPLLGLGFALRLVRSLATAARGSLMIEPDRFRLRLPTVADSVPAESGRG